MSERPAPPIPDIDRRSLIERAGPLLERARSARFFLTGGTGFIGRWILEALTSTDEALKLGLSATVLSRDPRAFQVRSPHLASHRAVRLQAGDIRTRSFSREAFDFVIHAAFDSSKEIGAEETWSTIVDGTERCLELAGLAGATRFLFLSSGAAFGRQPPDMGLVPDGPDAVAPGSEVSPYGKAKRAAEALCLRSARETGMEVTVARGFAFVGPHLPLDVHFAIGNFIRDALTGGPIRVRGDGTAVRSYLYASDLAVWLLTILMRGEPAQLYNVGSEESVSIGDLARLVARESGPPLDVEIARPAGTDRPDRYVPSTRRAREDLGLATTVDLREALRRTLEWHRGFQELGASDYYRSR